MSSNRLSLAIADDGTITAIYSDQLADLFKEGEAKTTRASHVEPCEGGWSADMSPVGGPMLGPFPLREEALAAEVEWLEAKLF